MYLSPPQSYDNRHPPREWLPSLALLRAGAALLVVYDHLVGIWLSWQGLVWPPAVFMEQWVFKPLHLMMHGGGFAVALFFMVSGFIIPYVAAQERRSEFVIKRALRIFPPLWFSCLLLLVVYALPLDSIEHTNLRQLAVRQVLAQPNPLPDILAALSLSNYLLGTPPINGVAWSLIIEFLFYSWIALLFPLLRVRPILAVLLSLLTLIVLQSIAHSGAHIFLLTVNSVYISFLFLGTLVFLRWSGRINTLFFLVGSLAFWGVFLRGMNTLVIQPPYTLTDYGVSYALAWLIFTLVLSFNNHIRLGIITDFISRISYSLYLNHGGLGLLLLTVLYPLLGYSWSLLTTFLLVLIISQFSYRWVELPAQRLARRWSRAWQPTS